MVSMNQHPVRALSPITELTTPTSLRTLRLPLDEADYHSERNPHPGEEDDASVYSQLSAADTVRAPSRRQDDEGAPVTPPRRQRTISLPSSPTPPPRSPRRNPPLPMPMPYNGSKPSLLRIPFPRHHTPDSTTPPPGGLPPPPRSMSLSKPKLIRRVTPPTTPTAHPENRMSPTVGRSSNMLERMREHSDTLSNIAGVGAGRSLAQEAKDKSASVDLGANEGEGGSSAMLDNRTRPISSVELPNVPILNIAHPSEVKSASQASRPNSLKKRPKSYHGSRPNSIRSRPNSFQGNSSRGHSTSSLTTPALGLDPVSTPTEAQAEAVPVNMTVTGSPLKDSLRPILVSHQSESSLATRSKSVRSVSPSRKSPRRRRVSSILSSIFEVDPDKDYVSRKLSKGSRKTSGSRGSSRAPSPIGPIVDSPIDGSEGDLVGPIQSAIRTSGTFGIRDDGSEVSHNPSRSKGDLSSPRHTFDRTGSGNGSVITHSDGVKRVLYVENMVNTPEEEDTQQPYLFEKPRESSGDSGNASNQSKTPPHSKVTPIAMLGLLPNGSSVHQSPLLAAQASPETLPPHMQTPQLHSLPLNGFTPSPIASSSSEQHRLLYRPASATNSTDVQHSSSSHLPLNGIPEDTVDTSVQTSLQSSPAKSTRSRPLPRPPSGAASPVATPRPTFIPPLPPSTAPATDLPLLIASHLLSTHAAALIRHSTSMKEVSETMHKMARESLDWGGVLMGMAHRDQSSEGLPQPPGLSEGAYEGIPLPRATALGRDVRHAGFPNNRESYDPLQQAYDTLTRQGNSRPAMPDFNVPQVRGNAHVRRRKGGSLPADLLKEAERLGKEGWTNLHKAEEAWSEAMRGLADVLSNQAIAETQNEPQSSNTLTIPQAGIASTLPLSEQTGYTVTQPNQRYSAVELGPYHPSSATSPDVRRHTSMSFLPDEYDMLRSPITPSASASASSQSHFSFPQAHVQPHQPPHQHSHPFQNIPDASLQLPQPPRPRMDEYVQNGSERTIRRPQSAQLPSGYYEHHRNVIPTIPAPLAASVPPPPPQPQQGYTSEHTGISSSDHVPPPLSTSTASGRTTGIGLGIGTGEDRMTPSRSTMSSSYSPTTPYGQDQAQSHIQGGSTKGKKLAKKYPPTSSSGKASRILGLDEKVPGIPSGGDSKNGSVRSEGGKRHWWNRKNHD
ncbi:uncharacterized protein I303_100587 [Kwoniella dejecticola CBS 10117]|uniref:Uncharacterized protein n=1 Tax=Kwoniella dejecticola CBS 10117 TaxID=1296121 RepID=A0A1A6AFG9_9TREE|nr:uncharacterized protein I303_00590 [Kwoniella dejecticola CBS 10117]OBR88773.1 hypothetical protein I303_00590 [Kwoniella dejecticola CBS 10117]